MRKKEYITVINMYVCDTQANSEGCGRESRKPLNVPFRGVQHHDDDVRCPGNGDDLPTSALA